MNKKNQPKNNVKPEKNYRNRIIAWAFYDWGDHAYITTTASTFFPPYFISIAASAFLSSNDKIITEAAKALSRNTASNIFAFTVSLALFAAAILSPIIGAYADIRGKRKKILIIITLFGGFLASMMFLLTTGMWITALALYFITQVIVNIALGLNSSLLPHVAKKEDYNRASSLGYAFGYIGGGLLLLINTAVFLSADALGISKGLAVRIAFLTVGIWWIIFAIPLLLIVPEPPAFLLAKEKKSGNHFKDSITRLIDTFRDIKRYKELFKMLLAFWFYMEGIGAIILLATVYGSALGLDMSVLIGTLLMTQLIAFPYALMYGRLPNNTSKWRSVFASMIIWTGITIPAMGIYANINRDISIASTAGILAINQLAGLLFSLFIGRYLLSGLMKRIDTKRAVILGLIIYCLIPIWGFFLHSKAEFIMIGFIVGTVQGGTQALSRTIYAGLSPPSKSGEFFGFYAFSEKFAGILAPLLYAIVGQITHDPRDSILSITLFFIIGIIMLWRVNIEKGSKIAIEEENAIKQGKI